MEGKKQIMKNQANFHTCTKTNPTKYAQLRDNIKNILTKDPSNNDVFILYNDNIFEKYPSAAHIRMKCI